MEELIQQITGGHVPAASIAFIIVSIVVIAAIFVGAPIFLKVKYHCHLRAFFLGCAVWLLFAAVLESLLHQVILRGELGNAIQGNTFLLAIYGGFMAALFEETGRFVAMKLFLKKSMDNNVNSIMYGAGHGGFEAVYILGLTMLNNLIFALLINSGTIGASLEALKILPEDQAIQTLKGIASLSTEPSYIFLIGMIERFAAIAGHIAMSVFVWYAIKEKKIGYYFIAFGFHFILDAGTVVISTFVSNMWLLEVCVYVMVIAFAIFTVKFYREKNKVICEK